MKHLIESLALCAALLVGNVAVHAQETTAAAATPDTPAAPAAPAAEEDKGLHLNINIDTTKSDDGKGKALISIDADSDADEDEGPVGRVIKKGVAEILEEHVLTRDDIDDEDREEIKQAIAELRNEPGKTTDGDTDSAGEKKHKRRAIVLNPKHDSADDDSFGAPQAIVAIVAIVFTLGMPILIVSLILFFGYRKRRLAHDTINKFLSSGKDIPPEIMQNLFKEAGTAATTPRNNLQKGTINTSIGLGMVIGFSIIDADFLAAIGFIFLLVGLAQLLISKLEQGKNGDKPQG